MEENFREDKPSDTDTDAAEGENHSEHVSGDPSAPAPSEQENWKEQYVRLLADFDNYRKRTARDNAESRKFANESLLAAFLPVLDNLDRALHHFEKQQSGGGDTNSLVEGVRLTQKQFEELLEKYHLTKVPTHGEVFDPNVHEAMGYSETSDVPEGTVVDVYQQGYRLHNRLVRPSLVTLARKP
jgi:molecular chaperone GrpE